MKIRERAMRVKRAAVSIHHAIHLARSIIEVVVEVEHIIQSITNVVRITLSSLRDHVDLSSESPSYPRSCSTTASKRLWQLVH